MKIHRIRIAVLLLVVISVSVYYGLSLFKTELVLKGDIENDLVSSVSTVGGKIVDMKRNLGEHVNKGDVIALIDSKNQGFSVEQLQAVVDLKRAKLEEVKAGARPEQIKQLKAQVKAAKAQWELLKAGSRTEQKRQAAIGLSIAKEAVSTAQLSYDYLTDVYDSAKTAYEKGAVTKADLDAAAYKKDSAGKALNTAKYQRDNAEEQLSLVNKGSTSQAILAAKANYEAVSAQLELAEAGAAETTIRMAEADLAQSEAQLAQAKEALNNFEIKALESGIIISKNYGLGDMVMASGNIADIAIDSSLYVMAYLPDKYLDRIKHGQKLKVKTAIGEIDGEIFYIALNHEYVPKDKQSTSESKHKVTKIKLRIQDPSGTLKAGMTGEILLPLK